MNRSFGNSLFRADDKVMRGEVLEPTPRKRHASFRFSALVDRVGVRLRFVIRSTYVQDVDCWASDMCPLLLCKTRIESGIVGHMMVVALFMWRIRSSMRTKHRIYNLPARKPSISTTHQIVLGHDMDYCGTVPAGCSSGMPDPSLSHDCLPSSMPARTP